MNIQDHNDGLHQTIKARDAEIERLKTVVINQDDSHWAKVFLGSALIIALTVLGMLWVVG